MKIFSPEGQSAFDALRKHEASYKRAYSLLVDANEFYLIMKEVADAQEKPEEPVPGSRVEWRCPSCCETLTGPHWPSDGPVKASGEWTEEDRRVAGDAYAEVVKQYAIADDRPNDWSWNSDAVDAALDAVKHRIQPAMAAEPLSEELRKSAKSVMEACAPYSPYYHVAEELLRRCPAPASRTPEELLSVLRAEGLNAAQMKASEELFHLANEKKK